MVTIHDSHVAQFLTHSHTVLGCPLMFGRLTGNRRNGGLRKGALSAMPMPPGAGALSFRALDPVSEPVRAGEVTLSDTFGRTVSTGSTDPYGMFVSTVPAGEYRLTVTAEGYLPYQTQTTVTDNAFASLGDVLLQISPPPRLPEPGDWEIEPMHTSIAFTARHIGLARIHGRFNTFAGAIRIGDPIETSAMHVVIDASSIDTNVTMRDNHLRSADFLDVDRFPTVEFYSDRCTHRGGNHWAVTGALTLHGVTRTVTLDTTYQGLGNGMEGETRAACRATAELHRDDFTVSWQTMLARGIAVVGPSVEISLDVQMVPKA
jgi:polyisoprenoid-binding protein YceI